MLTDNFTLITVVVSINQLLVSQELESPGQLENEIEQTGDYREKIESATNRTAPTEPSGFLRLVVEGACRDAQRLGVATVDAVPDGGRGELDETVMDLPDRLREIDIARQYFKLLYLQVELSRPSQYLCYTGLPAVGIAVAALFVLTTVSDPAFAAQLQTILFPLVVAIGVFPLALLFAYILRTATVIERTAAITPFTTLEQEV
ncbi:hypothetical protein [Haloterrigena salifodinae]|uniref:hypothetical protein n=1 Tax=Haloterrigena salifodinae TaxID=2675099 RepID=UPI001E48F54D|nr:hypothetical protein [Haloterrigena salifodinae]